MDARFYDAATDFGSVARWVYRRDPVLFTSELTALRALRCSSDGFLLSVIDGDCAVGAALQAGDAALLVSGLPPEMAKEAAAQLSTGCAALPGVCGTPSTATAFVDAWSNAVGVGTVDAIGRTLYRLDDLALPKGVPGVGRLAAAADAELIVEWLDGFFAEAFGATSDRDARRRYLGEIIGDGGDIVLWSVGGAPVSMARVHAPAAGMSRIGPVYTPPAERGRGFGAAATAAAVQRAHRRGARDVVLFADVANPGANRIYRRLGFVPVAENVEYAFTA
jgi:RimJ/RimL family protein N-acetyltransferase